MQSFPENTLVLSKIDKNIATFKDTYVLVSGFESDLRMKISQIVENATEVVHKNYVQLKILDAPLYKYVF